jgi:hypothetical protein
MANQQERELTRAVRMAFAPIMGIIFGVFMVKLLDRSDPYRIFGPFSFARGLFVLVSEAVMGFGVAISGLRMPWAVHGPLMGLIFSMPMSIWITRVYGNQPRLFFLMMGLNILFGLLMELVMSGVLRVKSYAEPPPAAKPGDPVPEAQRTQKSEH